MTNSNPGYVGFPARAVSSLFLECFKIIITIVAERLVQEALCAENFRAGRASNLNETAFMLWEFASSPWVLLCLSLVLLYLDNYMILGFLVELKKMHARWFSESDQSMIWPAALRYHPPIRPGPRPVRPRRRLPCIWRAFPVWVQ